MNITFDKTDEVSGKLIITVEEADYKQKVADQLKKIGRTHAIPGFRKGAVPMSMLQRRFGRDVTADVINNEVYEAIEKYITDNKLHILGQPMPVAVKELDINATEHTYEFEIGLGPDLDIELDKNLTLPYYKIEVSDEMMADHDKMLTQRYGKQEPVETYGDRALVKGSLMELNADGTIKEGDDAIQVIDGIVAPWRFTSDDEAKKFEGAKVNDKITFNPWNTCNGNKTELAGMLHIDSDRAADMKADFQISISEILGLKPAEHNEEFFKQAFGEKVTTEEQYNDAVRRTLESQLLPNSAQLFERDTMKTLVDKYGDFTLPDTFLKKWILSRNPELNSENIDEEYTKSVPAIKWQLISGAIADKLNVKLSEDDLMRYATHIAARQFAEYGMLNIDESMLSGYAKNLLNDKKIRPQIVEQAMNANLFNAIHETVTVDEQTVTLDRFKELANAE